MDKMITSIIKIIREAPERKMDKLNIFRLLVSPTRGFIL